MSFLLISDSYYPDKRSSALIIRQIYESLKKKKYTCKILTLIESNKIYKNKDLYYINTFNYRNRNFMLRAILTFMYILRMSLNVLKINSNPKIIYIYYPSFFLLLLLPIIKFKFKNSKIFIHYQDHFPENAFDLKIIRNNFLFNMIKYFRNKLIDDKISLIVNSKNLKTKLQNLFINNEILFFHNWSLCNGNYKKIKKFNKFTFVYAGNVGPAQNLNIILKLFSNTDLNINLKIIGDGRFFHKLKDKYSQFENIDFNNYLNDIELSKVYNKCHASLICLSLDNKTSFIPSKFYDYCKFKLPIFSLIHEECDLNNIIDDLEIGICVNNNNQKILNTKLDIFLKKYQHFQDSKNFNHFVDNKLIFNNFLINSYKKLI